MSRALVLALFVTASPAAALTILTTCANPCGVEEVVAGGTTLCTIGIVADTAPLVVLDAHYVVHHADGDRFVPAAGTPRALGIGTEGDFPATIATEPTDPGRLTLDAVADRIRP